MEQQTLSVVVMYANGEWFSRAAVMFTERAEAWVNQEGGGEKFMFPLAQVLASTDTLAALKRLMVDINDGEIITDEAYAQAKAAIALAAKETK